MVDFLTKRVFFVVVCLLVETLCNNKDFVRLFGYITHLKICGMASNAPNALHLS